MSLDISLYDGSTEIASMNWLRNPFGLCQWAEDNAHYLWGKPPRQKKMLWYVCNHWAYDKAPQINRDRFQKVVVNYHATLSDIEESFFFFDLPSYRQFIEPNIAWLPTRKNPIVDIVSIDGSTYDGQQRLMIPTQHFANPGWQLPDCSHARYVAWFQQLVDFAEQLQNPAYTFDCSN